MPEVNEDGSIPACFACFKNSESGFERSVCGESNSLTRPCFLKNEV